MEAEECGVMVAGAAFAEEQARFRYRVKHAWDCDWLEHSEPAHWDSDGEIDLGGGDLFELPDKELGSKALAALLARYGVFCPRPTRTLSAHPATLAPAAPLALRRPSTHTPSLRSAASDEHTHHRNASLNSHATSYATVPPDALTPPEDADARLGRFMRNWAVSAAPRPGGGRDGEGSRAGEKREAGGARPGFFLLGSLEVKGEGYGCCRGCCY